MSKTYDYKDPWSGVYVDTVDTNSNVFFYKDPHHSRWENMGYLGYVEGLNYHDKTHRVRVEEHDSKDGRLFEPDGFEYLMPGEFLWNG